MQAIGDAGTDGQVKRVEQVHAGAVVGQFLMLVGTVAGVEIDQQPGYSTGLHDCHQRVIQRHQQAQGVDQRAPESVLAHGGKHSRQSLV
ncbi:hypothetical protein D3C80_1994240 [compost metagenome]